MPGTLILCATPIGNLGDAPPRLGEALTSASVVYAEDTRRSRVLLRHLGVDRPLRSFFVGNEATRSEELAGRLQRGETVALVTDAGTPAVADPGFTAVRAAIEVGAEVTVVPGPSAVTAALAVSGLPTDRFVFEGFLPRSGKERRSRLESLAVESRTTILFAAAGRLVDDLEDLTSALGESRPLVICRELTKAFEEVWRGTLAEAVEQWGPQPRRGEFTLVVAGVPPVEPDLEKAVAQVEAELTGEERLSDVVRLVAERTGVPRRELYEAVHRRRGQADA
ncbi:MAG: 16S rRNA (cytidine(1402)-2'-O)-methyltransferase [Acidimicrobiia bacterium]